MHSSFVSFVENMIIKGIIKFNEDVSFQLILFGRFYF